jgi:signal recognition particle subunit SRP19
MQPVPVSTKTPVEFSSWVIIYPVYINKNKTIAEGRKMPVTKCVDNPTLQEIFLACQALQFKCIAEPTKKYSRDALFEIGRIRVQLKDETVLQYVNFEVGNSRKKLLALISNHINSQTGRKVPKTLEQEVKIHLTSVPKTNAGKGKGKK